MGRANVYDQTFLTPRLFYRDGVITADASPDSNAIPEIRLDIAALSGVAIQTPNYVDGTGKKVALTAGNRIQQCQTSARAYNGHLEIFAWFTPSDSNDDCVDAGPALVEGVISNNDERCHATLRVWAWGGEAGVDPVTGEAPTSGNLDDEQSSSSSSGDFGRWCLVHEQSILVDTLIVLRDIPASRYKVTVDFISANSQVDLLEQHTE